MRTVFTCLPLSGSRALLSGYLFGHFGSIHPMDKTPVGMRLALSALQHAYGHAVVSSGPEPTGATQVGKNIELTFRPGSVGAGGLLLRLDGPVRQVCPVGQRQTVGNPDPKRQPCCRSKGCTVSDTNGSVPQSQCGPSSGFELSSSAVSGGVWHAIDSISLSPDKLGLVLPIPPSLLAKVSQHVPAARAGLRLRYLFADWPTPTVYASHVYAGMGVNGQLPTPPFEMAVGAA
jgi:hypothetical protein